MDTQAITNKFIQKEVEEKLAPLIDFVGAGLSLIPGVGEAIGVGSAFAAAGLDVAATNTDTGIDFQPGDQFVHATNGMHSLACKQACALEDGISIMLSLHHMSSVMQRLCTHTHTRHAPSLAEVLSSYREAYQLLSF